MNRKQDNHKNNSPDPLTRIRETYTLAYTLECTNEADEVLVRHFLHTLAEIALAVASRNLKDREQNQ